MANAFATLDVVAVDDNATTLTLIRTLLSSLGVPDIRCCASPPQALALIRTRPPQILLTD